MGAAHLRPTWCLRSTLSTLQAWKKVQSFCKPDNCLFVVVWVTCKQRPAAQWSNPRRCSCLCAPQACALLPGHMWLEADWRTLLSTCNQHQRRRQYLGIHVFPRTGVLALTTGLPAEAGSPYILYIYIYRWSNFPTMQLTWHHGSTLNLVNRASH